MKLIDTILLTAALLTGGPALAHIDKPHAKTGGLVKKEQKAWGIAADDSAGLRSIEIIMTDNMRFTPDKLKVKQGETVKLIIRNFGAMMHEFVLGTKKELDEHAALMIKFPSMEHSEPYMAHVAPGKSSEIIWTFNRVGNFNFACLIAGHYAAGMVGAVEVVSAASSK